jgi:predicted Zn-dependent protease
MSGVENLSNVDPEPPRLLSEADCRNVLERLQRFASGGGYTCVSVTSTCIANVRWARNQISTSGTVSDNVIRVHRNIRGARSPVMLNDATDEALMAATRQAERLVTLELEAPNSNLLGQFPLESMAKPSLFSDATYQLTAEQRAATAHALVKHAADIGMLSAGYIEIAAVAMAQLDTLGRVRYFPYTQARYSVTVRDPRGTGSGWAGVDWHDWAKIDTAALTQRALEKCVNSRNPVRVEPGRYTVILEPQAVADFVGPLFQSGNDPMNRAANEWPSSPESPFHKLDARGNEPGYSRLGEQVVDERITISADPMDPELGFPPFRFWFGLPDPFDLPVYHPATWIERGVLTQLAYDRTYAIRELGKNTGLPNSGAFRMSGGTTSIDEMIATTERGLLVTRFDQVTLIDFTSQLYRGYTRDGLWFIEHGKISHPATNLVFTESPLFALNKVEQLGVPERVFHPNESFAYTVSQPVIVPPLKIGDFSFTALSDAV